MTLGSDVSNNDTQVFYDRRTAPTASLLRHCAEEKSRTDFTTQATTLPLHRHNALSRLISWLYALEPGMSLTAFTDLLSLL